jgi:uncharacterized protein (UPF0335 family)
MSGPLFSCSKHTLPKGFIIMSKTTAEKITGIETQIQQLENQRKQLMQQHKQAERKDRTKRLIERGAILESLIPAAHTFTNEQIKAFLEKTVRSEQARSILANINESSKADWNIRTGSGGKQTKT